jgi:hypothetical protein
MRYLLMRSCVLVLALALGVVPPARAHDPGMSIATLSEDAGVITFRLSIKDGDLPPERRASAQHCRAEDVLALWVDDRPVALEVACRVGEPGHTSFEGTAELLSSGRLSVAIPLLRELPRGHATFVRLLDAAGNTRAQQMLASSQPHPLTPVAAAPAERDRSPAWLALTGAAALVVLLVLLSRWRRVRTPARGTRL